jgi:hypothetical protein
MGEKNTFLTMMAAATPLASTTLASQVYAEGGKLVIAMTQAPRHLNG